MVTDSFESFAQSLRILLEANRHSFKLLMVDPHEAAGNIEQAATGVLNAFHSVYDSALHDQNINFDWYAVPETATILAIRNARHHNKARRIRGLYTYHLQQPDPSQLKEYLFVDYPETEDGGDTFDIPISWFDFNELLSMPKTENRLRKSALEGIKTYLDVEGLNRLAGENGIDPEVVFINLTPLIVNAAQKFAPEIKRHVTARSTEAKTFIRLWDYTFPANTKSHKVSKFQVFLPT